MPAAGRAAAGVRGVAAAAAALLLIVVCCEVWQSDEAHNADELAAGKPGDSPPLHEEWLLAGFKHTLE